ncbi:MAG: DNA polymerase III subunit beta [Parcubacteria group bacterium Greene0714_21]|nr:MAG: DNA polymerase III subunit beta [Parcubacteria group bacterium Greene0416_39]TSC98343.1 MAG: DNA polymerase III subunit beta [Parcubacteria group bacterium Greene1014_47]TSD03993.1 MAG: DNA polymerase III subunit beta [Parcubacteria group bacterium Greene0714_21]
MKSLILKENLKEALSTGERICTKSISLPILNSLLISAEKNFLQIEATDLEVGLRFRILSKNEEEGRAVIPSQSFSQYLSHVKETQLTLATENYNLKVFGKEFTTVLKGLNPEDFPIIPNLKGDEPFFKVEAQTLCKGLASVIGFTGQTQARPEISGVLFLFQKNMLKLVATDSFRLGEKTLYLEENSLDATLILPAKTCRELVGIFGEFAGSLRVSLSATLVAFDYENKERPELPQIQLISRVIEGEYPRYQDVIPVKCETTVFLEKAELVNQLKASSMFAGKTNEVRMVFDPKEQSVSFSAKNLDTGEHASRMKAKVEGAQQEASFNWRFLLDGILRINDDTIELGLTSQESPVLVQPKAKEGFLYVAMPIKA